MRFGMMAVAGTLAAATTGLAYGETGTQDLPAASPDASKSPASLCRPNEAIVFSCRTSKGKLISLCASEDASATTGYLAYRFGQNATSPELEYPKTPTQAKNSYRYWYSWFPKGSTVAVSFWIGQFRYSVFRTTSVYGYNGAGVIVNRGEKAIRVSSHMCEKDETVPASYEAKVSFFNLGTRLELPDANGDISLIEAEPGSELLQAKPGEPEDWRLRKKR